MQTRETSTTGWIVAFAAWTAICAGAFAALGGAEDPSRPSGRISPYQAEIVARAHLRAVDGAKYSSFETVDSALYRDPQTGRRIWLVLCDDAVPSRLTRAVVVEVDAASAAVIRTRRPGGVGGAEGSAR